ncbi:MAG: hypothetical protein HC892_15580 [Saprospiraceae bacterium]|nr:hypothetical protein [Saprospiraceae bacterium]
MNLVICWMERLLICSKTFGKSEIEHRQTSYHQITDSIDIGAVYHQTNALSL